MVSMKLGSKAEIFHLEGQKWTCTTELVSDIVVEVGEIAFHLHKFPLINTSGLLQKLIGELPSEDGKDCVLQLNDIPGGAKSFELVAKFCYNVKIELNALNVVYLRCAAEYLQMTEDHFGENLILQTENFLNEVFGNWKDSIKVLETCEDVLPQAEELHIVTRCINALATKACADPALFGWPLVGRTPMKNPEDSDVWNGISTKESPRPVGTDWWYEDVCSLSLPLYKRLILAVESKGMGPEGIAGSLMSYAKRYLPGLSRSSSFREEANRIAPVASVSAPSESDQRTLVEEIVGLLPRKRGVASTKFLLGLLRTAMILHANPSCIESLEKRIGLQLDEAAPEDILIPNLGYTVETLYDIDTVQRILDLFMSTDPCSVASTSGTEDDPHLVNASPSLSRISMVAKLLDGYLAEVAPDVNLKFQKFQSLAATVPNYARHLDDGIYRAIDIYLKTHPWLTDSEREQLCRLMNCQKLSLEACTHAAQNERLPLRVVVQVLFFEQLRLRTSIAGWFFDNMENPHGPNANPMLPKSSGGLVQTEITQDGSEDGQILGVDDMRLRVSELERELLSIKENIQNAGKPKSYWSILQKKFGIRLKYQQHIP